MGHVVQVCSGKSCSSSGSEYIKKRLQGDMEFYHIDPELIVIEDCFCQGRCKEGPTVVYSNDVIVGMNPVKASEILRKKIADWKRHQNDEASPTHEFQQ